MLWILLDCELHCKRIHLKYLPGNLWDWCHQCLPLGWLGSPEKALLNFCREGVAGYWCSGVQEEGEWSMFSMQVSLMHLFPLCYCALKCAWCFLFTDNLFYSPRLINLQTSWDREETISQWFVIGSGDLFFFLKNLLGAKHEYTFFTNLNLQREKC